MASWLSSSMGSQQGPLAESANNASMSSILRSIARPLWYAHFQIPGRSCAFSPDPTPERLVRWNHSPCSQSVPQIRMQNVAVPAVQLRESVG